MNPSQTPRIAILQFDADNPPGYLGTWLAERALPFALLRLDITPALELGGYDGYALMGGPMMVGDNLPWMHAVIDQLRRNLDDGCPILGHCLGGQMLAHAAGATVGPCAHPEVGWVDVAPAANPVARQWLGPHAERATMPVYHWHFHAFELPAGAELLLTRPEMPNQAFALGPHVGFQSHLEIDPSTLASWYRAQPDPEGAYPVGTIQSPAAALGQAPHKIPEMRRLSSHAYARWIASVAEFRRSRPRS